MKIADTLEDFDVVNTKCRRHKKRVRKALFPLIYISLVALRIPGQS